jgi:hypothetical protein
LQQHNKKLNETAHVHMIVENWIAIMKKYCHENTILVFDSYYFSAATRNLLLSHNIKTCASITKEKYPAMVNFISHRIVQPGDIAAMYNEEFGEFILGYWNPNPQGKKVCQLVHV